MASIVGALYADRCSLSGCFHAGRQIYGFPRVYLTENDSVAQTARLEWHLFIRIVQENQWSAIWDGWEGAMLSRDGCSMSLLEARDFLRDGAAGFVRPDSDSKIFDGGLYDESSLVAATPEIHVAPTALP